jgi:site-specific DNA-methyltransferase (adenine-specific)
MLETNKIYCIDCMEGLKKLPDESVDSIVTDSPYNLTSINKRFSKEDSAPAKYGKDGSFNRLSKGFMGKTWDGTGIAFKKETWKELLRVLKSGGHILSFGGTRTYHKMATAIEEAGFEIRDCISWVYGSGFPKNLNLGMAVDKLQGNEREIIGRGDCGYQVSISKIRVEQGYRPNLTKATREVNITRGSSEWEGWGTSLKPAHELICLARKPLSEKTIVENVLKHGTGGINIDESRIDYEGEAPNIGGGANHGRGEGYGFKALGEQIKANTEGRFPANLIHDGSPEVKRLFPESDGAGDSLPQVKVTGYGEKIGTGSYEYKGGERTPFNSGTGSASRFFKECPYTEIDDYDPIIYCPKASTGERNEGCEEKNFSCTHPTVKPVELMRYLCKLITPPKGIVLDPFIGSGTTAIACRIESLQFIGFEISKEYCEIAEARIKKHLQQKKLFETK